MGRHSWVGVACVLALAFAFLNHLTAAEDGQAAPPAPPTLTVTETPLGKTDGMVENTLVVSPDRRRAAFVVDSNGKKMLYIDGAALKEYDSVTALRFSPDSKRVAYAVERGGKAVVVLDGQDSKEYAAVGDIAFSPNSKRFAYAIQREKDCVVVLDGAEESPYETVGQIVFSPDSKKVAYVAMLQVKNEANPAAPPEKKATVVVNRVAGAYYDSIVPGTLAFSPDSKRLAYAAVRAGKQMMVVDGEEGNDCDAVSSFMFSENSKHFAYAAMREGKGFVAIDGAEETTCEAVGAPAFSADSQHLAYAARKDGKSMVLLDDTNGAQYDELKPDAVVFSPDAKMVCYAAKRGEKWMIVTEKVGVVEPVEAPPEDTEAQGGPVVRPAGAEGKDYDDILARSIAFSPDGAHVAYVARRGDKWLVVVDTAESAEYDGAVMPGFIVFDTASKLHALLLRGKEIFLLAVEVK